MKDKLLSDNEATEDMINKIESENDFSRNKYDKSEFMESIHEENIKQQINLLTVDDLVGTLCPN